MGNLIEKVAAFHDVVEYKEHHWTGTFDDYLELVKENPRVTRTRFSAFDMIMSYSEEYVDAKKLVHYKFSTTPTTSGKMPFMVSIFL